MLVSVFFPHGTIIYLFLAKVTLGITVFHSTFFSVGIQDSYG